MPGTLKTIFGRLGIQDDFAVHPVCFKCHHIFPAAVSSSWMMSSEAASAGAATPWVGVGTAATANEMASGTGGSDGVSVSGNGGMYGGELVSVNMRIGRSASGGGGAHGGQPVPVPMRVRATPPAAGLILWSASVNGDGVSHRGGGIGVERSGSGRTHDGKPVPGSVRESVTPSCAGPTPWSRALERSKSAQKNFGPFNAGSDPFST
ncbi:hypothetical protein B0H13DRAFT_1865145 [Mycena leptocephala]|nr:hypothetical protein B0H13DRAFT_1865145 [Mycena leptocephala]